MSRFHPAVIISGSIRTERCVEIRTYVTVQCSRCGHQFERLVSLVREGGRYEHSWEPKKTAKCAACNRLCSFDYTDVAEASNVRPLRRSR